MKIVIIYASSPVKRVVGEFQIDEILSDEIEQIWEKTKDYSGISKDYFEAYFKDKSIANAIHIGKIIKYRKERLLSDYNVNHAPQSFCYLNE